MIPTVGYGTGRLALALAFCYLFLFVDGVMLPVLQQENNDIRVMSTRGGV
jgi:uncharacterized membrane protein